MAVETRKRKRKTHLTLLTYIMILIGGSAVWLKLMLKGGTRSGHPLSEPVWMRKFDGPKGRQFIVEDFDIQVDLDTCDFKEPSPSSQSVVEKHYCGLGDAGVPVTARIGNVNRNMDGLFLTVHAAKDFDTWWQANTVLLPRELFRNISRPFTQATNDTLMADFSAALIAQLQSVPMTEADFDSRRVDVNRLATPLTNMFSDSAGAITVDSARVQAELRTFVEDHPELGNTISAIDSSSTAGDEKRSTRRYLITLHSYVEVYKRLSDQYRPMMEVKTTACLGSPGFVYIVGCVNSGKPTGGAYTTMCKNPPCKGNSGPPFQECRAISTSCGATCGSAAIEPADREDPSSSKQYCDVSLNRTFERKSGLRLNREPNAEKGGRIFIEEIQDYYYRGFVVDYASLIFAIMYAIGLASTFQMYMPGVGQRQGQRPTWDRLRDAIEGGTITTLTQGFILSSKIDQGGSRQYRARLGARMLDKADRVISFYRKRGQRPDNAVLAAGAARSDQQSYFTSGGSSAMTGWGNVLNKIGVCGNSVTPTSWDESARSGKDVPKLGLGAKRSSMEKLEGLVNLVGKRGSCEGGGRSSLLGKIRNVVSGQPQELPVNELRQRGDDDNPWVEGGDDEEEAGTLPSPKSTNPVEPPPGMPHAESSQSLHGVEANLDALVREHDATADLELMNPRRSITGMAFGRPTTISRAGDDEEFESRMMQSEPNGMTTVCFSISAGEGRNIVLRNLVGKIAANLNFITRMQDPVSPLIIVDGFADEGHRLGAYYMMRAISVAFYQAMTRPVALKVAMTWIHSMNAHEAASSVDKFDGAKFDVFALLPEAMQRRSEVQFIKYFHSLFNTLNAFTLPIDFLFERIFDFPIFGPDQYKAAIESVKGSSDTGTEVVLQTFMAKNNISDLKTGSLLYKEVVTGARAARVAELANRPDAYSARTIGEVLEDAKRSQSSMGQSSASLRNRGMSRGTATSCKADSRSAKRLAAANESARVAYKEGPSVFDPTFVAAFGSILFATEAKFRKRFETQEPLNAPAYLQTIARIDKGDPLGCEAYYNLRNTLTMDQRTQLMQATARRMLAHDHVEEVVTPENGGVLAVYIARGRPDKWRPWTKSDHRRVPKPGSWVTLKPADDSARAFWDARRKFGLLESVDPEGGECTAYFFPDQFAGIDEEEYYEDTGVRQSMIDSADPPETPRPLDGTQRLGIDEIQLLNVHLGKAGGLNFGLSAILKSESVGPPSPHHPLIFGIIDARHSCDERFWVQVLPTFHELRGANEELLKFDPEICLCQLAHSYIGMEHSTDKLDMRNDFLFTGMALIRDRCYGMTSCGTGGIWALTDPNDIDNFFYGRTMIEDTSTSTKCFLMGRRSVYIPPTRGTNKQLMRAVPKVSANYLDALERWDTGAVQCFIAQAVPMRWFYITYGCNLLLMFAVLGPTFFTTNESFAKIIERPFDHFDDAFVYMLSCGVLFSLFISVILLSILSPRTLNNVLRYLILLFNSIYPFNTVASVFWLIIPPWLCLTAEFPFNLDAATAIIGSMILKVVEFSIVSKMKKDSEVQGSELDEMSIFRSQQMDKVTVPIKLRAIYKGCITGYRDVFQKHDNSWWESFGGSKTAQWVKIWLMSICFTMLISILASVYWLLTASFGTGSYTLVDVTLPVVFGLVQAVINIWVTWDPLIFILKGNMPRVTLRYVEAVVMVSFAIMTLFFVQATS